MKSVSVSMQLNKKSIMYLIFTFFKSQIKSGTIITLL